MIRDTSAGKMFLASERGHSETDRFRSYQTFPFGAYQPAEKAPFGSLYLLNDDTLAGGQTYTLHLEEDSDVVLIPTVGAIHYKDNIGNETTIEAGQVQYMFTPAGTTFLLTNPYEKELVNLLQLWIRQPARRRNKPMLTSFSLDDARNSLVELFGTKKEGPKIAMGKFDGRQETEYHLSAAAKGVYVLVLEGAFEVQYRLLETRDGLALWHTKTIELEALSNEAIILLVEVALS